MKKNIQKAMVSLMMAFFVGGIVFGFGGVVLAEDMPVDYDFQVNDITDGVQSYPRAVLMDDENIFVVWVSRDGDDVQIRGKIVNQSGETVKEEFAVSDVIVEVAQGIDAPYVSLYDDELKLKLLDNGNVMVVWDIYDRRDISVFFPTLQAWAKVFDSDGGVIKDIVKIDENIPVHPDDPDYGSSVYKKARNFDVLNNGNVLTRYNSRERSNGYWWWKKGPCVFNIFNETEKCLENIGDETDRYIVGWSNPMQEIFLKDGNILLKWEYQSEDSDRVGYESGIIIDQQGNMIRSEFRISPSEYENKIETPVYVDAQVILSNKLVFKVRNIAGNIKAMVSGVLRDECVVSKYSTNPDWGWNWAGNRACQFSENNAVTTGFIIDDNDFVNGTREEKVFDNGDVLVMWDSVVSGYRVCDVNMNDYCVSERARKAVLFNGSGNIIRDEFILFTYEFNHNVHLLSASNKKFTTDVKSIIFENGRMLVAYRESSSSRDSSEYVLNVCSFDINNTSTFELSESNCSSKNYSNVRMSYRYDGEGSYPYIEGHSLEDMKMLTQDDGNILLKWVYSDETQYDGEEGWGAGIIIDKYGDTVRSEFRLDGDDSDSDDGDSDDSVCVDWDGDGWGWDGEKGCKMSDNNNDDGDDDGDNNDDDDNNNDDDNNDDDQVGECIDWDGDGWGWDGEKGCKMNDNGDDDSDDNNDGNDDGDNNDGDDDGDDNNNQVGECYDWDGDGWGWDGEKGCKMPS